MKILFISKYATFAETSKPSRQYFLSKELTNMGCDVMLVGSRSVPDTIPSFWGIRKSINASKLKLTLINEPKISYGFNVKRIFSLIIF